MSATMNAPLAARLVADYERAAAAWPSSRAASARRRAAIESLTRSGLPGQRDENWKYANLRPLERLRFVPAAVAPPAILEGLPPAVAGYTRYVFVDGVFAPALSAPLDATSAALKRLESPPEPPQAPAAPANADERFALLNEAFATDGIDIRVAAGSANPPRLELLFVASADAESGASYPRLELHLEPHASLSLIERHVSAAGHEASFVNSAVRIELERGATLSHDRLQELGARATSFDTLSAVLAPDATYHLRTVASGAQSARSTLHIRLAGERSYLTLAHAALGDRHQVQDAYALVEHTAPRARTVETFRGIASGRARVAFNGKIVVAPGTPGTDTHQSLRGLLAGPEAEIDVRPQLEIYTDEVRCSHGATAGKLDENMLFYLLSRGLERESAERLMKWAFLEDVIAKIGSTELRRQVEERLLGRLGDEALRELL